jgi:hypothetical protein
MIRKITFEILVGINIGNKNPLLPLSRPFIDWAGTEGGCWWWIRDGVIECLKAGMIVSRRFGSLEGIRKEQIFISEFPFTRYSDLPKDFKTRLRFATFQDLLIEEWLNFINGVDIIREGLLTDYDILTI